MRPEDGRGIVGIANSGYSLDPDELICRRARVVSDRCPAACTRVRPRRPGLPRFERFCGACHDVRLFGTDVIGVRTRRALQALRNAYSEWVDWAEGERRAGREPASCQDCHMRAFPACASRATRTTTDDLHRRRFVARARRARTSSRGARGAGPPARPRPRRPDQCRASSALLLRRRRAARAASFRPRSIDEKTTDAAGIPLGARQRRDLLLGRSVGSSSNRPSRSGPAARDPGGGRERRRRPRVPAGSVRSARSGSTCASPTRAVTRLRGRARRSGRRGSARQDFLRVNTDDGFDDGPGRPSGLFGADVADGRDVPRWSPNPALGGDDVPRARAHQLPERLPALRACASA